MALTFKPDHRSLKQIKDFEAGKEVSNLCFVNSFQDNKSARLTFEFEALSDIYKTDFSYSVFVKLMDPESLEAFELLDQEAANFLPKDIEYKSILREDKLFIKLQVKDDKFVPRIDPPISPDALDRSPIHQGSELFVEFQPNLWINFQTRTAGIFMKIYTVTVDGGKRKNQNRRR